MSRYRTAFFTFCLFTQGTYAATTLDTKGFIDSIQGAYHIELVDGQVPKPDNSLADVYADTDEGVFTMPYCPLNGLCDPGYTFFPYAKTTVTEETLGDGSVQVTLEVNDGAARKYTWNTLNGKVKFHNPHFKVNGVVTPLTHQLVKPVVEPAAN